MYSLPKLHKRPYKLKSMQISGTEAIRTQIQPSKLKTRFIANSGSCTTTELSNVLTSCFTAIKVKVIKYMHRETVYDRSGKNVFWPIKKSGKVLSNLKDIGYQATRLSTYNFSTLYTTLPHNMIKEKILDLIERTFYKKEGKLYLACNDKKALSLLQTIIEDITFGLVRMYVTPYRLSWTIFILG